MGTMSEATKVALRMGAEGADNRILMRTGGTFSVRGSDPPTFTREEIAQQDTGGAAFVYWQQQSDRDPHLDLVIEGVDCATRLSRQFIYPMKRSKPNKYPALMTRAGEGRQQPGPEVPPIEVPRYGGWDLGRFIEWSVWKIGGRASLASRAELKTLAGFAWVCGDRGGTWQHPHVNSSGYEPTESGVRLGAASDLAMRGRQTRPTDVGGQAAYLALWWPVPGGACVVCADPASGVARQAQLVATPQRGALARLTSSNTVTFGGWESVPWQPVEPL